eukprot:3644610-Rhodomonas_salina.2
MLEAKTGEGPAEWVALGQTVRYAKAMWVIARANICRLCHGGNHRAPAMETSVMQRDARHGGG